MTCWVLNFFSDNIRITTHLLGTELRFGQHTYHDSSRFDLLGTESLFGQRLYHDSSRFDWLGTELPEVYSRRWKKYLKYYELDNFFFFDLNKSHFLT